MSRDTEKKMWKAFRTHLPATAHAVRIESWAGEGVPDVNLCYRGNESWVENKVASPTGIVKFRPGQVPWLHKRHKAGGRCYVLVRWQGEFWLVPGVFAQNLAENGMPALNRLKCQIGYDNIVTELCDV